MFFKKFFVGVCLIFGLISGVTATNYDLREAKYPIMDTYKAEAFVSNDIYEVNASSKGIKKYYTNNLYAVLMDYQKSNVSSGFNAGLYKLSNGKYILAFRGTTVATDKIKDTVLDIVADLNLLNKANPSEQPREALEYFNQLKSEYGLTKENTILTGHSLGGGLAQHVSYNTGFKAVTFNTAPFPIPCNLDTYNTLKPVNIVNIMSNKDPLTATLALVEDIEGGGHDFTKAYHSGELLSPIANILNTYGKRFSDFKLPVATILATGASADTKSVLKEALVNKLNKNLSNNHIVLGALSTYFSSHETNLQDFLNALDALERKDIKSAISHLKKAYNMSDVKFTNLILGERIVLQTDTGHGVLDLIKASYRSINNLGLIRIKETNPDFYRYIKGTFVNDGVPFPVNSRMKDSLISRVMYYYYKYGYESLLDSREKLEWTQVQDAVASKKQIQDFSAKYLNLNGLIAQSAIAVSDAMLGSGNMDKKMKDRVATLILDSGKSEVINMVLTKDQAERAKIVEDCIYDIPWFKSVGDIPATALKELLGEIPDRVIKCAAGQVVESTSRFVNAGRGTLSLREYNSLRVAHKYLDRYYVCGINNSQCMADAFGGKTDISDQLQYIMEDIGADGGGLDWTIRNYAKFFVEEYQKEIAKGVFNTLDTMSIDVQREYNYGNRHTNTLDAKMIILDYDKEKNIIWVNLKVDNLSGREIELSSFLPLIVSQGKETPLAFEANGKIYSDFIGQTIAFGESKSFARLPINLGDLNVTTIARLVLLIDYKSTDGVFEDHIQRIRDFDPRTPPADDVVQSMPYSSTSGSVYFELPENATLTDGMLIATKGERISFSLGYDAKYLRDCLAKAKEGSPSYKVWYIDKSIDESNTKVESQVLQFIKIDNNYVFVMPSDKLQLVDVSYVDLDQGSDNEETHCPLPEWDDLIANTDSNATDTNTTDSNTTGETYEECVARGGTEIGCRVGVHEASKIQINGNNILINDNLLYIASRGSLVIYNMENILKPQKLSSLFIGSHFNSSKIKLINKLLYLQNNGSLIVVDVADPSKPIRKGSITDIGDRNFINSDLVYSQNFTMRGGEIVVTDIHDIQNPKIISRTDSNYLVGADFETMHLFDVGKRDGDWMISSINIDNPTQPKVLDTYILPSRINDENVFYSSSSSHYCNHKLFIRVYSNEGYAKTMVFDIDSLGRINLNSTLDVPNAVDISYKNGLFYFPNYKEISIYDSQTMQLKNTIASRGVRNINIIGNYLYAALGDNGIRMYDISNPSKNIFNENSKNYLEKDIANEFIVDDNYMYVSYSEKGIKKYNISDITNPVEIASNNIYDSLGLYVDSQYLFSVSPTGGLSIYNKDTLNLVKHEDIKGYSLVVKDDYAYIARGLYGVSVWDISDLNNIVSIESSLNYSGNYSISNLCISNNILYLGHTGSGANYDISDPTSIKPIYNSGYNEYVACQGDVAWVTTGDNSFGSGLRRVEEKNGGVVNTLRNFNLDIRRSKKVKWYKDYLFVSDAMGIKIINISDKNYPYLIGKIDTSINVGDMVIKDDYILINFEYKGGFEVLNWKEAIKIYSILHTSYNPDKIIHLIDESPKDNTLQENKFIKTWMFSENIEDYTIEQMDYTTEGHYNPNTLDSKFMIKEGNTLSIELTPSSHNNMKINEVYYRLKKNGRLVLVDGSPVIWSKTIPKESTPPKLADGQVTQLVSTNTPAEQEVTPYDSEGNAVSMTVVDNAGGDVSIEDGKIVASFDDGQTSHVIKVMLDNGVETTVKEFTVLNLDEESIKTFYDDVDENSPFFDAIAFGTLKGIIEGSVSSSDTTKRDFRPKENASLAESLKMIIKASKKAGLIDLETGNYYRKVFPSWAMPYYSYARDVGALEQEESDLSTRYPTREEIAKIVAKTLELDKKLSGVSEAVTFNDKNEFSDDMLYYAQLTKLFGLFMTEENAHPQEPITREELAQVIQKIFMMPHAKLTVNPATIEYGSTASVSLTNTYVQNINASTHMLYDAESELKTTYVAGGIELSNSIDTSKIPKSTKKIYAILDNHGVRNILSTPIELVIHDQDKDGVEDSLDKWIDDDRYAYDNNNNGIPDILDIIYDLDEKTPADMVLIDGVEVSVADIIFYGGGKPSDEPLLKVGEEVNATVEKDTIQYYKLKAKAGEHLHVVLNNLSANLDLYVQDVKRPKRSDFVSGPGVSSGEQPTISMSSQQPGTNSETLSFSTNKDKEIYIAVDGRETGNYTLKVVKHADYLLELELNNSIPTNISKEWSYYKIHGERGDTIKIKLNTKLPPFGNFDNNGVMLIKAGSKPTNTVFDCKKEFKANKTYECNVKLENKEDVYIALKDTKGSGDVSLVATLAEVDTDGDGIPDYKDPDIDGDGVPNAKDAFPKDKHEWLDTDRDGIGNNADTDDDNDGISDKDEIKWGFDPLDASDANEDADGDGVSNKDEIEAGSNPLDSDDTKKPKKYAPIMVDDMIIMVPIKQ